jgi:acyl-coenzyme A thioesterase PaaI-like protein
MSKQTGRPDEAVNAHTIALERLKHELTFPPFHALFSPQVISVDPVSGVVTLLLPYRPSFRRSPDVDDIHGGVIAAVMAPTIDLRIDYLRPVPGVDLTITARTLRVGRSIGRADVEVNTGPGTALLAVGRGSFSTINSA